MDFLMPSRSPGTLASAVKKTGMSKTAKNADFRKINSYNSEMIAIIIIIII